jgi:hypothetical protein
MEALEDIPALYYASGLEKFSEVSLRGYRRQTALLTLLLHI